LSSDEGLVLAEEEEFDMDIKAEINALYVTLKTKLEQICKV
jgi:hypothetical protein